MRKFIAPLVLAAALVPVAACGGKADNHAAPAVQSSAMHEATAPAAPAAKAPGDPAALVALLNAHGIGAANLAPDDEGGALPGWLYYTIRMDDGRTGHINVAPSADAYRQWLPLVHEYGGVVVDWPGSLVSLQPGSTDTTSEHDRSLAAAQNIAAATGGTVHS